MIFCQNRSALNQDVQIHVFFPLGISRTEISRTVRCLDHRGQHQFFELVFIVGPNTVIVTPQKCSTECEV